MSSPIVSKFTANSNTNYGTPVSGSVLQETTIYQNLAVQYKKAINTIAVNSNGKFAVLGGYGG